MNSEQGEDLGFRVRVVPSADGEVIVTSPEVGFGWRLPRGQVPGTAVQWRGRSFEVVGRERFGKGNRWILRKWTEAVAMRTVFQLDEQTVAVLATEEAADRRHSVSRGWTLPFLPVLGLAPGWLQKRWANTWGYSAERATWLSIVSTMLIGGFGLIQSMALAFGGDWFLPSWLRPLAIIGPFLFAEGMLRNALVAADGEPVGSVLGLPLNLIWKPPKPTQPAVAPRVRKLDDTAGTLEFESPIYRMDWDRDGLLSYRGQDYRLDASEAEGQTWVYRFTLSSDETDARRRLRLIPPPVSFEGFSHDGAGRPSILRTALVTAAVTLGPQVDQEIWADHLNLKPIWLTIFGAGAQLVGGLVNLGTDIDRGVPLLLVLNLYLIAEGLMRMSYIVARGRPIGSVLGWILRPLYRRWLPPGE